MTTDELRQLLQRGQLSQRGAARLLEIHERSMRRYCAGDQPVPKVVELALLYIIGPLARPPDSNRL